MTAVASISTPAGPSRVDFFIQRCSSSLFRLLPAWRFQVICAGSTQQNTFIILNRQVVQPLHLIDEQLASMSGVQAAECCTREDYQRFLAQINLSDGKVAMINGAAGLVAARNASAFYTPKDLKRFTQLAAASSDGFAIADFGENNAVSIKSVKLSGGDETGSLIYVRPIYSMQLINTFGQLKVISELILMGSLAVLLAIALVYIFRPVARSVSA